MRRDENTPTTSATWNERFPFAHAYMQEMVLCNPEPDPHVVYRRDAKRWPAFVEWSKSQNLLPEEQQPEIIGLERTHFTLDSELLCMTPLCPGLYWEVKITAIQPSLEQTIVGIGLHDDMFRLSKFMYPSPNEPVHSGEKQKQPLSKVTDVLGCGMYAPYGIFFTHNGRLIDLRPIHSDINTNFRLCMQVDQGRHSDTNYELNLGQEPFCFDIVTSCRSFSDRIRRRAATLPIEIMEEALAVILLAVEEDMDSGNPSIVHAARRTLSRISSVCRRWRTLCRRYNFPILKLTSGEDLGYALAEPALWNARILITDEQSEALWIHSLLAATLPNDLIHVEKWEYTSSRAVVFNHRLPPCMSHAIASFLRRGCFANITRLTLTELHFGTWLHFARFVFSLRQLHELFLSQVTWIQDKTPPNLPHWIRFSRRIRKIKIVGVPHKPNDTMGTYVCGLLCLLIAGRRLSSASAIDPELEMLPQDAAAVACVIQALWQVTNFEFGFNNSILYEQVDGICTLTCQCSFPSPPLDQMLVLQFLRHPLESVYQLAYVKVAINDEWNLPTEAGFKLLATASLKLSNRAHCGYCFDVREPNGKLNCVRYQLPLRWYIHKVFQNELRTATVLYDPVASQSWSFFSEFDGSCPVNIVEGWKTHMAGQHVIILWSTPPELRESPPRAILSMRCFVRPNEGANIQRMRDDEGSGVDEDEAAEWECFRDINAEVWEDGAEMPVEYAVRHIASLDMGVADVVLPKLRTHSKCIFEITLNECVCRSWPVPVKPSPHNNISWSPNGP